MTPEVFILLLLVISFLYGALRTFKRHFVLALIALFFITPFWVFWAIAEISYLVIDFYKVL